jgi:hypothetical protein
VLQNFCRAAWTIRAYYGQPQAKASAITLHPSQAEERTKTEAHAM